MIAPVFFSPRVLSTINALPENDRKAIAAAITGEFILGAQTGDLTPVQTLVMAIIRRYVEHDTRMVAPSE